MKESKRFSGKKAIQQSGVLALAGGAVCLVTNSSGRRWTIPKGHVEPGMTLGESAVLEAFEEAGVTGELDAEPFGTYSYKKRGVMHLVVVYVLRVHSVLPSWPEAKRRTRWFLAPREAAEKIELVSLRELILRLKDQELLTPQSEAALLLPTLHLVGSRP